MRVISGEAKKRLREKKGETLIETLVAILIVTLALVALPYAVTAAARVNRGAEDYVKYCDYNGGASETATVKIEVGGTDRTFSGVSGYSDEGYYYYE